MPDKVLALAPAADADERVLVEEDASVVAGLSQRRQRSPVALDQHVAVAGDLLDGVATVRTARLHATAGDHAAVHLHSGEHGGRDGRYA